MTHRRILLALILFATGVCLHPISGLNASAFAEDFFLEEFNPAQFTEYERQLNAILKTRRDEEKLFVSQVVEKVRQGKLPSKLIQTSFQWSRSHRPDTDYPFIYFEKVLRLQAAKINLEQEVPPFDYSVYRSAGQRTESQQLTVGQKTPTQESADIRSFFSRLFRR